VFDTIVILVIGGHKKLSKIQYYQGEGELYNRKNKPQIIARPGRTQVSKGDEGHPRERDLGLFCA
jgi:hypothetical protein